MSACQLWLTGIVWRILAGLDPEDARAMGMLFTLSDRQIDIWERGVLTRRARLFALLPAPVLRWLFDHTTLLGWLEQGTLACRDWLELVPADALKPVPVREVLPAVLWPLVVAIAQTPLDIYQVCRRNVGTLHVEAWRQVSEVLDRLKEAASWLTPRVAWQAAMVAVFVASLIWPDPLHAGTMTAAFTNFYVQSGGNSMNAGSSTANAADVTETNGDWGNAAANRFTAASGTPFSAVTTDDYASIYPDGTTSGAVYVAKVTAINGGGASIDLSTTIIYGTAPTTSATGRSCKINGAWADETALVQLGATTVPQSTKVNWKQATYTVTAGRTIALDGATTTPLWISGYNTTPGDLDADTSNSLSKPDLAFSGGSSSLTTSGDFQIISSLSVAATRAANAWNCNGQTQHLVRVRCDQGSNSSGAAGLNRSGGSGSCAYAFSTVTRTTSDAYCFSHGNNFNLIGCVADAGGTSFACGITNSPLIQCVSLNSANSGFSYSTGSVRLTSCTAYSAGTDGVAISGAPGSTSVIVGCLFVDSGGYGINNSSGTNTAQVFRACNDFYNNTSGNENGFGDHPAFFGQTESSSPVTSSTDMTPVVGSNARNNGFPGVFENQSFDSDQDIGAVRHDDPAAGGGLLTHPGMAGGFRG